jgi:hypothetical protein
MLHRKGLAGATLALLLVVPLMMASSASAAPVEGPAGEAFYTPPATLPEGGAGTLIWFRPTTVNLNVELPAVQAYDILYKSSSQINEPMVVTGTVIVPTAAWTKGGPRPVVDVAPATQGLGHQCAPSIQMANGTEYDGGSTIAALKRGYAVVMTDYQGYTTGATPSYIAGKAEGHAVLDAMKAALQVPSVGIEASAPVVVWGYSQGGHAAGWAGQLEASYAPELHIVGVAAGGIPGNLLAVQEFGEGSPGSALGLDATIGLAYAYAPLINPEALLSETLNAEGLAVVAKLKSECAVQSLEEIHDVTFQSLTKNHETAVELEHHNSAIETAISQQKLGGTAIPVPVYHYHGLEDEFVPIKQDAELHQQWCSLGVNDDFQLYPGEHLLTDPTATPYVAKWVEERFEGKAAPSTCGQHSSPSELPPTARLTPEVGDLIVPLPNWQITGTVTAAKLGIPLKIPAGATLNSEDDVTKGTLTATLTVPPINETVRLFGLLPVNIQGALEPVGTITGTSGLSNTGILSINATGAANLVTKSIGISFFRINLGCHTSKPIEMPLDVSVPANAIAVTGSLSITDSVTIPPFTGCGPLNSALVTGLLSGPGNTISITSAPAPPVSW